MDEQKRTIRNIPLPQRKNREESPNVHNEPENEPEITDIPTSPNKPRYMNTQKRRFSPILGIVLGVIVVAIAGVLVTTFMFSSATIAITPKTAALSVDTNVVAELTNVGENSDIAYQILPVSASNEVTVEGERGEAVERHATGTIEIRNIGTEEISLIPETRFELPNGSIYRIASQITVPGASNGNPGVRRAEVTADQPGETYNVDEGTFTVPGLEGDPRFEEISAVVVSPITGGFIGEDVVVDEESEEMQQAIATLRQELASTLQGYVPQDFLLINDTVEFSITTRGTGTEASADNMVEVILEGTATGKIIKKNDLLEILLAAANLTVEPSDVTVVSYNDLTLRSSNVDEESQIFDLELDGDLTVEWVIPEDEIKEALSGVAKSKVNDLLQEYESISEADVTVQPFWRRSLPQAADITVVVNNQSE